MNKASNPIRVRFAPSPTGFLHLGGVRTALLNYLFAEQKNGTFVLRIEDTDPERNFDPKGKQLLEDLQWLGLTYAEGGTLGGPYGPYYQSQRTPLYQEQLDVLKGKNAIYRCFCTTEELERKRVRSIALKMAPRYDRTCLKLTQEEIQQKLADQVLFIWRFKIPDNYIATVHDLAHGKINFDLNHFSDFPLTRSDGTFTFLFANCVDDILMKITHVLRGEDHLSNTANQIVLFETFGTPTPLFWHLPVLCNADGKKMSKRDFGFSLQDLKMGGFLPEAINNYLAITGGSFTHEIMDMKTLIPAMHFDSIKPVSNIRYDVEKLKWVNHKWIQLYDAEKLVEKVLPFLQAAYPSISNLPHSKLLELVQTIKSELVTLNDVVPMLNFYFEKPIISHEAILEHVPTNSFEALKNVIQEALEQDDTEKILDAAKSNAKKLNIPSKLLFTILRLLLTGSTHGPSIHDIMRILGPKEVQERLKKFL
jgi:nondiscriminating glutamyl-tRNA synthetase